MVFLLSQPPQLCIGQGTQRGTGGGQNTVFTGVHEHTVDAHSGDGQVLTDNAEDSSHGDTDNRVVQKVMAY